MKGHDNARSIKHPFTSGDKIGAIRHAV